jgi:hypothetical protein
MNRQRWLLTRTVGASLLAYAGALAALFWHAGR